MKIINDMEQGSIEWHKLRWGKVTGTSLKSATGTPTVQNTLMYKIIGELMTEVQIPEFTSEAMQRGNDLEPIAIAKASETLNINFEEVAFLDDESRSFGISPDAIYKKSGEIVGGLEVKCPSSSKHIEYILKDTVPSIYKHQVYAPFLLSDKIQFWYFASYDDRNYEMPLFIKKVMRPDEEEITKLNKTLDEFLFKVKENHSKITF